jgi:hypothetical protein
MDDLMNDAGDEGEFFPSPITQEGDPEKTPAPVTETQGEEDGDTELWPDGHPLDGRKDQALKPQAPAKKDPSRFEYWQGQAAREKARADQLAQLAELGKKVLENPALLSRQEAPAGDAPRKADAAPAEVTRPTKPTAPAKYDETEAYNEPNSESFKYRKAKEQFQMDMLDFYAAKDEQRAQVEAEGRKRAQAQAQAKEELRQLKTFLVTKKGLSEKDAIGTIQMMQSPEDWSVDNMIALYKLKDAGQTRQPDRRELEILRRRERQGTPLPGGLDGEPTHDDDESAFNRDLLSHSSVRRVKKG